MYRDWTFFQTLIDNAQLTLRKADLGIGQHGCEPAVFVRSHNLPAGWLQQRQRNDDRRYVMHPDASPLCRVGT